MSLEPREQLDVSPCIGILVGDEGAFTLSYTLHLEGCFSLLPTNILARSDGCRRAHLFSSAVPSFCAAEGDACRIPISFPFASRDLCSAALRPLPFFVTVQGP